MEQTDKPPVIVGELIEENDETEDEPADETQHPPNEEDLIMD